MDASRASWALFDKLPDISALLDENGDIVAVNEAWKSFCRENDGNSQTYYVGQNYIDVCFASHGESDAEAELVAKGVRRLTESGHEFRCEYPCHSPSTKRWFEMSATRVASASETFLLVSHRNITTRYVQREEVRRHMLQANELAALVATSPDAILSYDLDGNVLTWNQAAQKLYGYGLDEIVGQSMEKLYPDDWDIGIKQYRDKIIAGELKHFEVVRRTKAGEIKNISVSAAPVRDEAGEIVFISNIHRDITDRIKTEEQLQMTTRELTHRTKNMFAVVSAVERQTASSSDTIADFHDKFAARLGSLMASNDLLVSQDWQSVSLHELARSQLGIYADGSTTSKIVVSGPPVVLQPDAVQAIGLGLHELATNAAKYGALTDAAEKGQIKFTWQIRTGKSTQALAVCWTEKGISVGSKPKHQGFGHTVLTKLARQSLDADVQLTFKKHQLSWRIEVPAKHFDAQ